MSASSKDWQSLGFATQPRFKVAEASGLLVYRCWGARSAGVGSSEWGSGYFSLEKPRSVLEAELRFNIVDWNNGVNFVSTFRLLGGFGYWIGSVLHASDDISLAGTQIYVDKPLQAKLVLVKSQEVLRHDVVVSAVDGRA